MIVGLMILLISRLGLGLMENNMLKLSLDDVLSKNILKYDISYQQMKQIDKNYQHIQKSGNRGYSTYKQWQNKHTLWELRTNTAVLGAINIINDNLDYFKVIANVIKVVGAIDLTMEAIANYLIWYYWDKTFLGYHYEETITECFSMVFGAENVLTNDILDRTGADLQLLNDDKQILANIQIKNISFLDNLTYKTEQLKKYSSIGAKILFYAIDNDGYIQIAQSVDGYCLVSADDLLNNSLQPKIVQAMFLGRKITLLELRTKLNKLRNS